MSTCLILSSKWASVLLAKKLVLLHVCSIRSQPWARVSRRKTNYWARQVWLSVIFLLMFWVFQFFIPFFRLSCTQGEANAKLFRTMHRRRKTLKWEVSSQKNDFPHQSGKTHILSCYGDNISVQLKKHQHQTDLMAHPPSFPLSFRPSPLSSLLFILSSRPPPLLVFLSKYNLHT